MTMGHEQYDVVVVGGGVNGTGIAMDAAGRNLKVLLCEMNDLASATSSNSSKLIHGGLRYLEHYEFRLVQKALAERESLLKNSPHIMWPMRFRLPHRPHLRPAWMIRTGLFLYDHLAKREMLPGSRSIRFDKSGPLKPDITKGFEYSDGWVDDARLVILTAKKAQESGATILTRTKCVNAVRGDKNWTVTLRDMVSEEEKTVSARVIVNASGPWVSKLFGETLSMPAPKAIRMVKGSHIVVPKLNQDQEAYILQNEDERIVFVIPYEDQFSLVGTTDVEYEGDPKDAKISPEETDYLLKIVNAHFVRQLEPSDVVWSYSGVRPLMDGEEENAQKASRDYSFEIDQAKGKAPLISVFGGKITTYRKLAEVATNKLCHFFPEAGGRWTKTAVLPGGDFATKDSLAAELKQNFPWLADDIISRYVRTYGTASRELLQGCTSMEELGQLFTGNLYEKEVQHLVKHEWAMTSEDILWRRTKQGLYASISEVEVLDAYLEKNL
ncbi:MULTISPECIES: glycerol-3-phosphate dehydrogenase [unclassified Marinobacter]|uniref:glycerol-3-phosphate dehydrogenase n=1 Tax=unclassified Marinobacter TaxID=83889 RepID=UPI001903E8E9|nr:MULTISPECIES: glycerol-3-phosphate dehydrogenase [unclassified Marinobacter]MBK1871933.1 glycerol-3-phosphate dehydrogenase [Marinobacter sp. 1-3A]MBK1885751.1 glycerol-3-phosphate dehydrogenase [Marinobacter sp. DY40_1A1]